jgi:hypothetical protein
LKQIKKTPLIIIAEDKKNILQNQLERAKVRVEAIWESSFTESISAINIFTRKHLE